MIAWTFRPAIWLPISSRLIMKPFDMSLPTAAPPPVICVRKPTFIGPFCAHVGPAPALKAARSNPEIAAIALLLIVTLLPLFRSGPRLQQFLASLFSAAILSLGEFL